LGGDFTIETNLNNGTTINAWIPLKVAAWTRKFALC
jgi:hypothetical protein